MSFNVKLTPKDRATGRFMSRVHRALIKAINKAKEEKNMTQVQIAEAMGLDKSVVSRILSGEGNLTLKTIGDIAWSVGLRPDIMFHTVEMTAEPLANHPAMLAPVAQPRMETTMPVEIPHAEGVSARPSANGYFFRPEIGALSHAH